MTASDLKYIIKFQSPTLADDSMGGQRASGWVTDKTTKAKIEDDGSSVDFENNQKVGFLNFIITCRYQKDFTINTKMRILWGTRELTPQIPVADAQKQWITIEASEKIQ